jgi:hypothetical protein
MGVIDLIQFPNHSRRTGELIVVGPDSEARLFYQKGKLTHATMGEHEGLEVLVHLVDFTEGEFEFRPDITTDRVSLEGDLHRLLMQGLKVRDERKLAASQRAGQDERKTMDRQHERLTLLKGFHGKNDFALYSCLLAESGEKLAEQSHASVPRDRMEPLLRSLQSAVRAHPRSGLIRTILEDAEGFVVAHRLDDGALLVVVASPKASLGAVSMAVHKLALGLQGDAAA